MLELGYKVSAAQSCPGGMHLLLLFHFALFFSLSSLFFFFKIQVRLSLCCLLSAALFSSSMSRSCRQFAEPRYRPARASVYV